MTSKKTKVMIIITLVITIPIIFKLKTKGGNIDHNQNTISTEQSNLNLDNKEEDSLNSDCINGDENNEDKLSSDYIDDSAESLEEEKEEKFDDEIESLKKLDREFLVLVNRNNNLNSDYVPDLRSVNIYYQGSNDSKKMHPIAAEATEKMFADAKKDGFTLLGISCYRSYWTQKEIFDSNSRSYGQERANRFSAKAGQSDHQTGLAIDIGSNNYRKLHQNFQFTDDYKWLKDNCYKYGFILRYPEDSFEITGYIYEPWHYRYVGIEHATYIMNNNITLEKYIQLLENN